MLADALRHGRTKLLEAKALVSFAKLVRDPNHLDEVFEIADALSEVHPAELAAMIASLSSTETGARAFRERPRLGVVDLSSLAALPPGTLGHEFALHMRNNALDPAALPTLTAVTDADYLRAHLYETHDIWHVVLGFRTDVAGEIGLQAFYLSHTAGPLPRVLVTLGFVNAALFAPNEFATRIEEIARGYDLGKRVRPLFGVRWAELWAEPIEAVRHRLGIPAPPSALKAA